jgi:hypothetical protein
MAYADVQFPDRTDIVLGRILNKGDTFFNMNLMYFSDRDDLFKFEEEESHVQKEYILTTFDDPSESDLGIEQHGENFWIKTDPNYHPSSESEADSEEESVVDSDEEDEEEED